MEPTDTGHLNTELSAALVEEIATVIDLVCAAGNLNFDKERQLRTELFALLENPTQNIWERVRELEALPHTMPELDTPSPIGLTVGDIVYMAGLDDVEAPSQAELLRALKRVVKERSRKR